MNLRFLLLFLFLVQTIYSQTYILQHDIDWSTHNQNMWGPNGSPFNIDTVINLFSVEIDEQSTFGFIENFLGGQFGAQVSLDTWFKLGSDFTISGFTTGSVDVDYPVSIFLEIPQNNTFCPGENVTIKSWYTVRNGWNLETHFPSAGVIALTMDFGLDLDLDATVCVFTCTTFPVLNFHIPYDTITIVGIDTQTGVAHYPCFNPNLFPPITICTDTVLPITFNNLFGIGLSGWINIPYVETTDYLDATSDPCHKNLYANGHDTWIELQLDIVQFLSAIAGLIPPPQGPAIQQFLQNLSGNIVIGPGISIYYNLFSAWLTLNSSMVQNFTFKPYVWNHLTFPTPVEYTIVDPQTNNLVDSGQSSNVDFLACHNLTFKWPCFDVSSMNIGIKHSLYNEFTNHTWDSIAFSFTIQALHFIINLPVFMTHHISAIPPICVPVNTPQIDTTICIPQIVIDTFPPLMPDLQIVIGPLIDITWPLGYIPITWYNNTWELEGFHEQAFPDILMSTTCPEMQIESLTPIHVLCYGESTGSATVTISSGKPPYTYQWSNGFTETTNNTSSTITNLPAGIYTVTITDAFGCQLIDQVEILNAYPPLSVQIIKKDVTCVGGSDGEITLNVQGGLPPYSYIWNPNVSNTNAAGGLPAGTYSITVIDANNCDTTVSTTLIELHPLPPVNFYGTPREGCQPLLVQFYEISPDEGQTYLWNFGNGLGFSMLKNPSFLFTQHGTFDVSLTVTSIYGCENSLTFEDYITVYEKPVAQFFMHPPRPDIIDPMVYFFNQSTNTFITEWHFGDGGISTETHTYHIYPDTGQYNVTLFIETEHGCRDTAYATVYIRDAFTIYIPNAFSPSLLGQNQIFKPTGYNLKNDDYKMQIFNRWGTLIFESNDIEQGWNGMCDGELCPQGTYIYIIQYRDLENTKHTVRGTVQLIR